MDLGPSDTTLTDTESLVLDAGNQGAAYLWSTGETTRTIIADTSGIYWVRVVGDHNCTAEDTIAITFSGTGLQEGSDVDLRVNIFPNPVETKFFISGVLAKDGKGVSIEVLDLTGQVHVQRYIDRSLAAEAYEMDVSSFTPGLYLVRIEPEGHPCICRKIIIK